MALDQGLNLTSFKKKFYLFELKVAATTKNNTHTHKNNNNQQQRMVHSTSLELPSDFAIL